MGPWRFAACLFDAFHQDAKVNLGTKKCSIRKNLQNLHTASVNSYLNCLYIFNSDQKLQKIVIHLFRTHVVFFASVFDHNVPLYFRVLWRKRTQSNYFLHKKIVKTHVVKCSNFKIIMLNGSRSTAFCLQ